MLDEVIHQRTIFNGFNAVTNTLSAQLFNGLPDAFRSRGFARMHGNMPAGVARAWLEVRQEQAAWGSPARHPPSSAVIWSPVG